jgi:hypothetical protein
MWPFAWHTDGTCTLCTCTAHWTAHTMSTCTQCRLPGWLERDANNEGKIRSDNIKNYVKTRGASRRVWLRFSSTLEGNSTETLRLGFLKRPNAFRLPMWRSTIEPSKPLSILWVATPWQPISPTGPFLPTHVLISPRQRPPFTPPPVKNRLRRSSCSASYKQLSRRRLRGNVTLFTIDIMEFCNISSRRRAANQNAYSQGLVNGLIISVGGLRL